MRVVGTGLVGLAFGFVMSRVGFTSWDLVHGMFAFTEFHLLFTFMMAVTVLVGAWWGLGKALPGRPPTAPRGMHPGVIVGSLLFGAGWALSGGCPTIALAQVGEGKLAALYTVGGIVIGNWLYSIVHERYFKWPTTTCLDE